MVLLFTPEEVQFTYSADEIPILSYAGDNAQLESGKQPKETKKYYENYTYIDWSLESAIVPKSSLFISRKWLAIVMSSLIVGYITTFIDFTSVWLNDLKKGLCFSKIDKWSLINPYSTCPVDEWYDWSRIIFNSRGLMSNILVNFPIYFIFAFLWILLAAYITIRKDPLIKQSGIPEIKLIISGFNYNISNYLGIGTLFYKIIGLILVVSSGLWLGKEGPLVHVSCCIQNILYTFLVGKDYESEGVRRELLSAATATGISVAFNSPIGGVLFVLESMPSFFMPIKIMWNSFISATIAIVVLTGFKIFTDGENFHEQELFSVEFGNFSWLFMEVIPFILLGILGGIYGHLFIKLNSKFSTNAFRSQIQFKLCKIFNLPGSWGKYLEIFAVLLITTLLNFPIEITKLPLHAYLKILFTDCPTDKLDSNSSNFMCSTSNSITILKLFYIIIQGFLLSSYTFGTDLPGGILMPSLVIGATSGRLLGIISQILQSKFTWDFLATCTEKSCLVSPSSYAVIGAASFMSGITKLTMSVVVIMFELTGAVSYVLPIMLAVMTSKFVNDWLCNENIYDAWLKNNFNKSNDKHGQVNEGKGSGFVDFTNSNGSVKNKLPDLTIKSVMISLENARCLCLIPEIPYTLGNLYQFINDDNNEGYPLILNYENPISLGYVNKQELFTKLSTVENNDSIISFQIEKLPKPIISQQLQYEQSINSSSLVQLEMLTENSIIILNDQTPIVLVLEIFEKLHLNYLIIKNNNHLMSGFVDRFLLANLIHSEFKELKGVSFNNNLDRQFDIEDSLDEDELINIRRERLSVELLN